MDIKDLRIQIDSIDGKIIELFEERMKVSKGISDYKNQNNLPLFDKLREEQVISNRMELLSDKSLEPYAKQLIISLMELSKAYQYCINTKENIVLIGMMGSGKTEKGKIIAQKLGLSFVDIDDEIVQSQGISISEIFEQKGEDFFRKLESEIIEKYTKKTGYVISTGGGAVLIDANMEKLKNSGKVFFLNRDIDHIVATIDTKDRPLLKDGPEILYEIYNQRLPLYRKWCDFEMTTQGSIEQWVNDVIEKLY